MPYNDGEDEMMRKNAGTSASNTRDYTYRAVELSIQVHSRACMG